MHARGPAEPAHSAVGTDLAAPTAVLRPLADVAGRQGLLPLAEKLGDLRAWLADDLAALEDGLARLELSLTRSTGTERAMRHLLNLPGKRIRPLCVMLAAKLGRADAGAVRATATACELVHAATLLHDDVVDDSTDRRGAPAARVLFGNSASILAGDHLLVHAISLVHQCGAPALLDALLQVMRRMVSAEALQLERRGTFVPSREAYLEVIRGKTAALFGWGLTAGGQLAHLPPLTCQALQRVGLHLGMAFQLVDDVLDLDGDPETTGKAALQDVREGKLTWPLILASERDPSVLQDLAGAAQASGALPPAALKALLARIADTGALADTRAFALEEAHVAQRALETLPNSRAAEALMLVVHSAVHRIT